jgi:hypothetical protein
VLSFFFGYRKFFFIGGFILISDLCSVFVGGHPIFLFGFCALFAFILIFMFSFHKVRSNCWYA